MAYFSFRAILRLYGREVRLSSSTMPYIYSQTLVLVLIGEAKRRRTVGTLTSLLSEQLYFINHQLILV